MAGNQILRVRSHAGQRRSDDSSGPFLSSRRSLAGKDSSDASSIAGSSARGISALGRSSVFAKPPSSPGQDLLLDGKLNRMF